MPCMAIYAYLSLQWLRTCKIDVLIVLWETAGSSEVVIDAPSFVTWLFNYCPNYQTSDIFIYISFLYHIFCCCYFECSFLKLRNNIVKWIDFKCTAQQIFICVHMTHTYDQTKIWSTLRFFFFFRKHAISTTVSSKSCFDVLVKLFLIPIKRTNCKLWMLLFHLKASCVVLGIVISFTYSSVWNFIEYLLCEGIVLGTRWGEDRATSKTWPKFLF